MLIIYPLLLCLSLQGIFSRQLVMIECLTRHGVRYPQFVNQHDHSNITTPAYLKQLTPQGRQMHYLLGRMLQKKYWNQLFPAEKDQKQLNRSSIYAKSTDTNRTIQSLQNLLYGFLAQVQPQNEQMEPNGYSFPAFKDEVEDLDKDEYFRQWKRSHSVPIHVEKGMDGQTPIIMKDNDGDFLAKQEASFCPNQKIWQKQAQNSQQVKQIIELPKIVQTVAKLQQFYPGVELNFSTVFKYVDNYYCLKAMGKPYLKIFEDEKYKQYLDYLYIARLYTVFLAKDVQVKAFSKTLLETTIQNFRRAAQKRGPKMIFYSGHDSTLAILLAALKFVSLDCLRKKYILNESVDRCYWEYPKFASSFIFQLWQEDDLSYSVEIAINGVKQKIPVCNYQKSCKIEDFQLWFEQNKLKETPNEVCGIVSPTENCKSSVIILADVFLALLLCAWIYYMGKWIPRRNGGSRLPSMEETIDV